MATSAKRPVTKAPKGGKGSAILARVTQEARDAIDAEVERTGRSISSVVELGLERGRAVGDPVIAEVLPTLFQALQDVRRTSGDPTSSIEARDALRDRWSRIAQAVLPDVESAAAATAKAAISAFRIATIDLYGELDRASSDLPHLAEMKDRLRGINAGKVHPGASAWRELQQLLEGLADEQAGSIARCAKILLSAAAMAELAVDRVDSAR